jgi:hypothetical protein
VQEINHFICKSPKGDALFGSIKLEISPEAPGLCPLCPTRWTVRAKALKSLKENYQSLMDTFAEISKTSQDEFGMCASGLLNKWRNLTLELN